MTRLMGGRGSTRRAALDEAQLSLDLPATVAAPRPDRAAPPPRAPAPPPRPLPPEGRPQIADELLARLRALGLATVPAAGGIDRCRLTRNRTVMISFRHGELRLHRGYHAASDDVLRAVVAFVHARTRAQRAAAQRVILTFPVPSTDPALDAAVRSRGRARTHPADEPMERVLVEWHRRYNARHFGGQLCSVPIRVSRRLRRRLGHYTAAATAGLPAEIVIGRSHIRRHGWEEALHTLLHEMVHQWQDETGHAIDHGRSFRRKAHEVGITPAARRAVGRRDESAA